MIDELIHQWGAVSQTLFAQRENEGALACVIM
jgi:hypothetical protein